MESWLTVNSPREGHDKLVRLAQYSCKIVSAFSSKPGTVQYLESNLAQSRKLLRMGTCVDAFYAAAKAIHHPDPFLRFTNTMSRIASGMYLVSDHLLWLNSVRVLELDKRHWAEISNKCWLYSIILTLVRDLRNMKEILEKTGSPPVPGGRVGSPPSSPPGGRAGSYLSSTPGGRAGSYLSSTPGERREKQNEKCDGCLSPVLLNLINHHNPLLISIIKNSADIWLPLASLGYIKVEAKVVGLCGVVSSVLSIYSLINRKQ